jgi:RNA polymerase sigma-70 factor (ECF subfamily)
MTAKGYGHAKFKTGAGSVTDEELARQAGTGSHACFETLTLRYAPRLFHFLRKRLSNDQDVEDLVQETFIKAYQNIDRYDTGWKFSTWLYTIAVRLTVSHYRSGRAKLASVTQPLPEMETASSASGEPADLLTREQDSQNLWLLARSLKQDWYDALWLRYVEEMSIKEIAAVMKKTQIYVRVLLHRARLKLTRLMRQPAQQKSPSLERPSRPKVSML